MSDNMAVEPERRLGSVLHSQVFGRRQVNLGDYEVRGSSSEAVQFFLGIIASLSDGAAVLVS